MLLIRTKFLFLLMLGLWMFTIEPAMGQKENRKNRQAKDTLKRNADGDVIKTGLSLVPLPDLRVDPYTGFRMGAVFYLYNFGDGARYPNFKSNTIFEGSYGTKGATNFRVRHQQYGDKIIYAELNYQNQIAAPFFGINGFQQSYNEEFIEPKSTFPGSPKNPLFYNYHVQSFAVNFEIQDTIEGTTNLNWLASLYSGWYDIKEVNLSKLNEGLDPTSENFVPDTAANLYGLNKQWGLLNEDKLEGGKYYTIIKGELIYDKRDRITNPMKGILSRIGIAYAPKLSPNSYGNVIIANASHTHYITIRKKDFFKSSIAYRFKYLGYFAGKLPYNLQEGIGGITSAWGVHQNRAMVRQWASGQFELRTRGFSIHLKKTNLDFWGVPFFHAGYVIQEEKLDLSKVPFADKDTYFNTDYDRWYVSYGWMGKMVINKNVALGFDLAWPMNTETGPPLSMFIGMGFSFRY